MNFKTLRVIRLIPLLLIFPLLACSTPSATSRHPAQEEQQSVTDTSEVIVPRPPASGTYDYSKIFQISRDLLTHSRHKKIRLTSGESVSLDQTSDTQLIAYLTDHEGELGQFSTQTQESFDHRWKEVGTYDPRKHVRLVPPQGQPGYSEMKIYVNHPYNWHGKTIPKSNLKNTWIQFIQKAKKQIILNVFDFDLPEVAAALVAKAQKKVQITVGVDRGVLQARPEVQAVAQTLRNAGIEVVEVDSVGLNHQKITVIDWDDPSLARVLLSSGNLTQSCIGPEGDLKGQGIKSLYSIPNANHLITLKSYTLARLIRHELAKTLNLKFRGSDYPLSGSYQITGPGVDPYTLESYPVPSLTIAFAPKGGLGHINKTMIAHVIEKTTGPIYMMQFAFSSADVGSALLTRAQAQGNQFQFYSVGDTPFAMQYWSQFLLMSGLQVSKSPDGASKKYIEVENSPWLSWTKALRPQIRIAPAVYGNHQVKGPQQKAIPVSAKIHHKMLTSDDFAIIGTSFNFSDGAETNNEQLVVIRDPAFAEIAEGMVMYMHQHSAGSVYDEAMRRNRLKNIDEDSPTDGDAESALPKAAVIAPQPPQNPSAP